MNLPEVNHSISEEKVNSENLKEFEEGGTCHYCNKEFSSSSLSKCKIVECGKMFCRRCLTSKYKFSKLKAAQLPTPCWKCPSCTYKCLCPLLI